MSIVDVKTPPQFTRAGEFSCHVVGTTAPAENLMAVSSGGDVKGDVFKRAENGRDRVADKGGNLRGRKRFNSLYFAQRGGCARRRSRHNSEKIVLPTKFLLGGNISDPLNLNSLTSEDPNEKTPVSSPLPTPMHRREQEIDVIIPPNITDPLNLNSGEDIDFVSPKSHKRKRNKHKRRSADGTFPIAPENPALKIENESHITQPISVDVNAETEKPVAVIPPKALPIHKTKIEDQIVSPVIPQISPKSRKRKRQTSECRTEPNAKEATTSQKDTNNAVKGVDEIVSPVECTTKFKRQQSHIHTPGKQLQRQRSNDHKKKFIYGNYNRYYGYRNPNMDEDHRLHCLKPEWILDKDVLDIGCNVGHVTLEIARKFSPRKIVGLDIDPNLIAAARKNIRHYLSAEIAAKGKYPDSMSSTYGPIVSKRLPENKTDDKMLNNVRFSQANFVPESDELLELAKEEYDVILAFSLTKWMHLHHGDGGLKRAFKRMFKQLRPGGILLLEPQSWSSYKKKKNLTDSILNMFKSIKFHPDQFTKYLLSSEVGFSTCQLLDVPFNKSKGFRRPIQMYTKSAKQPSSTTTNSGEHETMTLGEHVLEPESNNQTSSTANSSANKSSECLKSLTVTDTHIKPPETGGENSALNLDMKDSGSEPVTEITNSDSNTLDTCQTTDMNCENASVNNVAAENVIVTNSV